MNTKDGARAYEQLLRTRLARDESITTERVPTLLTFQERWLEGYVRVYNKPSEYAKKTGVLRRHLLPAFGHVRLNEITRARIDAYTRQKLVAGLNPKTINNQLSILRKCLSVALEWDLLDSVPHFRWLRVAQQEVSFLEASECEHLLQAEHDRTWRTMILVGLRTGMRLGELRALEWTAVDVKRRRLVVRQAFAEHVLGTPKSGRIRHLPLSQDAHAALEELRAAQPAGTSYVFCSPFGKPFTRARCSERIARAYRRAGLKRAGWHKLRHTFASHLVMAGVPMRVIQGLLGHSTIAMTERYAHLAPYALHDAVETLVEAVPLHHVGHYMVTGAGTSGSHPQGVHQKLAKHSKKALLSQRFSHGDPTGNRRSK